MKNAHILGVLVLMALAVVVGTGCRRESDTSSGAATDQTGTSSGRGEQTKAQEADNTGRNVRDRNEEALTPGDQGASASDREITRKIRRAITSNDQLSTSAKNIKIITVNGKVTLRGPVQNEAEKQTIATMVQQAGVQSVDDQLELKAPNQ